MLILTTKELGMKNMYDAPRVVNTGEKFKGGNLITFAVIDEAVISDGEGVVIGTYEAGSSYQDVMPEGVFVVTSGSIKIL